MSDIIEEIINEEKDAKRLYYFRKILPTVVIIAAVISSIIAGYGYYKSSQEEHNQKIGDIFIDLFSDNISDKQVIDSSLQEIIENSENRLAELADIKKALIKLEGAKEDEGLQILAEIIDTASFSEITTSYARILWLSKVLTKEKIDDNLQAKASTYLQFFNDDKKVFFASANLIKALFYYKNKQFELARVAAEEIIKMPKATAVIKEQAYGLLTLLKYKN